MEDKVIIDLQVVNKTLEYLSTRPYGEVAKLIEAIQQNATVVPQEAPETSDAE